MNLYLLDRTIDIQNDPLVGVDLSVHMATTLIKNLKKYI